MPLDTRVDACDAHAATFYVTVAGLGGEPDYEQRFASQAQEIDKLLHASSSDAKVTTLYGPQATKAQRAERAGGKWRAKPSRTTRSY